MGASDLPKIPSDAANWAILYCRQSGSNRSPTRTGRSGTVREKPRFPWRLLQILRHRDGAMPGLLLGRPQCLSVARSSEIWRPWRCTL